MIEAASPGIEDGARPPADAREPSATAVRAHVQRVLRSVRFSQRGRLRRFLEFTVEQALQGRGAQLNEYLLGIEVFGKEADFDPRLNAIVRVEAHRLRAALDEYYAVEGAAEPIRIRLEKGSYEPMFETARASKRSIAVLPFVNLTPEKDQEYLCDGLAEGLIALLARNERLHVVSRTSAFAFKGRHADIREIARVLNASVVLEGSIRTNGGQLWMTAQLVGGADGYHLWSETYRCAVGAVAETEEAIARSVVEAIGVEAPTRRPRPPVQPASNPKAFELYLMGRYHWNKRTVEGLRKAVRYFEAAVAEDRHCAHAYAGLADTYCVLPGYGIAPPGEAMPKARCAALEALRVDADLAEAHTSLASVHACYDWDATAAEREFRRALQISPGYATAHHWYAGFLRGLRRSDEAHAELERALALDPLSPVIRADLGPILRSMRRHDEAIALCRSVIEFEPDFHTAHLYLGIEYAAQRKFAEAIDSLKKAASLSKDLPLEMAWLGYCFGAWGRKAKARGILTALDRLSRTGYVAQSQIALVHIGLGDLATALTLLDRACEERDWFLPGIVGVEPVFDPLRGKPGFQKVLERVGRAGL